ncbi:sensor histidine kinase [Parafrankia irregularis]|uniref:sensor histidine kinase n=2 Tax=Parafrankia TaxID=2994362 RepID=UPI001F620E63|nr:nitrate- and nitrite sensing domain-containing protein [Parafrankia irregularis]
MEDNGHHGDQPPTPPRPERAGGRGLRQTVTDPTNWRVRTKLIAILAVPVVAILVNSSIQAASVLTSTRDVNRIRDLIEINRSASTLVHALQEERTYTAGRIASSGSSSGGGSGSSAVASVAARQTATNDALTSYQNIVKRHQGSFGPEVRNSLRDTTNALGHLANLRKASTTMADPSSVRAAYSPLITSLIDLVVLIPQGNDDPTLLRSVNAADHLVRANEEIATTQTLAYSVILSADPFSTDDYREFLTAHSQRIELVRAFEEDATPAQLSRFREKLNPDESLDIKSTDLYTEQILEATTGQKLASPPSEKWARATQEWINLSSEVDATLFNDIDDRVDELRGSIQRGALLSGLLIVFILASALLAAVVVARSLVRPLLSLRTAALDVAGRRLPEAVRRLRDSSDQTLNDDVEPIGIDSDEEIGEVARAFDAVHREAVRLASEQAVLRNNVNAMFVNLSRRSQGLVERQLRLIDDLENREQDPDQLANLFKLDHLATRMRRNNESLLVLAGTDTARRWTHPVPVNEVVLAAISEVEQYTRVKQTGAAPVSIAGSGVSDVVHLIAELLENATSYSPPVTDVLVSSHSLGPGAGAMIEIEDQGIGMPAKELERVNDRLANPPVVDVSVSRTMGLFAVGRLASRHGIRVQLRESASGGITAVVRLPAKLVTGDSGATPSGPRPAALSPGTGGRDAAALPPARGNALPPAPERNGLGAGLQTTNFSPVVDPAAASAAGGSSYAPASNGLGRDPGFGQPASGGFATPGGASLFDGSRSDRSDRSDRNGQYARDPRGYRDNTSDRAPAGAEPGGGDSTGSYPMHGRGPEDSGEFSLEALNSGPLPLPYRDGAGYGGPHSGEQPRAYAPPTGRRELEQAPEPGPDLADTGGFSTDTGGYSLDTGGFSTDTGGFPLMDGRYDEAPPSGPLPVGPVTGPTQMYSEPDTDALQRPGGVFNRAPSRPSPEPNDAFPQTGPNLAAAFRSNRGVDPTQSGPLARTAFGRGEDTGEIVADEQEGDDALTTPIFDSVSAWFQRRTPEPADGAANGQQAPVRPGPVRGQGPARPAAASVSGTPLPRRPQPQAPARPGMPPAAAPRVPTRGEPLLESPARGMRRPGAGIPAPAAAQAPRPMPQTGPQRLTPTGPAAGQTADGSWSSAGDEGWKAAEQLRQPSTGGTTRSGLPVRVPMTHLVPGSAEPAPRRRPPEPTTRSPEAVGGRLASFYQGVRQGRDVGVDTTRNPRRDAQEER